jgi:hypothetical protein
MLIYWCTCSRRPDIANILLAGLYLSNNQSINQYIFVVEIFDDFIANKKNYYFHCHVICKYVYQVKGVCHSPSAYPTIIIWQQIPHHREGIHKQPPLNVLSSSVCTSKAHNWYIISIVYFRSTKRAAENIYIYSNLHCYDSGLQSLSLLVRKFFPNRMADIITVLNSFLVYCALFFSFIDIDTACTNTAINWNCPGGYIVTFVLHLRDHIKCSYPICCFVAYSVINSLPYGIVYFYVSSWTIPIYCSICTCSIYVYERKKQCTINQKTI